MRISRKTHSLIDYAVAIVLIASGWVIVYPDDTMRLIGVALGAIIACYSAMTDYEGGLLRFIPFPMHRGADLIVGIALAFSPIHFAAYGVPVWVFILAGALLIFASFFTRAIGSATGVDQPLFPG